MEQVTLPRETGYNSSLSKGNTVHIDVKRSKKGSYDAEKLLEKFKLTSSISMTNMYMFDPKGKLKKYDTLEQTVNEERLTRNRKELISKLKLERFEPFSMRNKNQGTGDYNYLLNYPFCDIDINELPKLFEEKKQLQEKVNELMKETPKSFWLKDLDVFETELKALQGEIA
ncbi:hypothetical protein POM88_036463 [Heracleum sosnowskyi]|uniref:DNA topoisomerase (ATP-hydrolyzing) n=1 Tax=Heracleum sosnowskyi TaxID=360622 RepID=A0AAD8HNF7_9APIA|nr:hypothetical protein POM88_036463 [Heracleum sosnowskyi]